MTLPRTGPLLSRSRKPSILDFQMMGPALLCLAVLQCCLLQAKAASCKNGDPIQSSGLSEDDQNTILDIHNKLRDQIAAGGVQVQGGKLPSASNMPALVWDDNLAAAAQAHANECRFAHFKPNPEKYGKSYGQNLYMSMSSGDTGPADWEAAVQDWYDEYQQFSFNNYSPFKFTSGTGHFTQVIWGDTVRVGCGYTQYTDSSDGSFPGHAIYTCNYGPAGNMVGSGKAIYQKGTSCSACDQCDSTYTNLCAA